MPFTLTGHPFVCTQISFLRSLQQLRLLCLPQRMDLRITASATATPPRSLRHIQILSCLQQQLLLLLLLPLLHQVLMSLVGWVSETMAFP